MPRYQYACTVPECGHEFEAVQSFSDDSLTSCPACEGRLRKVFAAVGVVFKGSGFYRTDSRAESHRRSGGERARDGEKRDADRSDSDKGSPEKGSSDKGGSDKGGPDKGGSEAKSDSKGTGEKTSAGSGGGKSGGAGSTKAAAVSSK